MTLLEPSLGLLIWTFVCFATVAVVIFKLLKWLRKR
jgi:hypothetical protein